MIESLEMEMELLCLTGVEDQLQTDVRPTLEILRNAGIKVGAADALINTVIELIQLCYSHLCGHSSCRTFRIGSFYFNRNEFLPSRNVMLLPMLRCIFWVFLHLLLTGSSPLGGVKGREHI